MPALLVVADPADGLADQVGALAGAKRLEPLRTADWDKAIGGFPSVSA